MFNASVNLLISQARNPTEESQQELYNEFVRKYGTSYVSHAIVGGIAHWYSFIEKNYHTTTSYVDIVRWISLSITYNEYPSPEDPLMEPIYQGVPDAFKENSHTMLDFLPSVNKVNNESIVQ